MTNRNDAPETTGNGLRDYWAVDVAQAAFDPATDPAVRIVYFAADVDALLAGERATHAAALAARDERIVELEGENKRRGEHEHQLCASLLERGKELTARHAEIARLTKERDRAKWAQGIVDSVARENTGLLQDAQAQIAELQPLAEIGRLAVELRAAQLARRPWCARQLNITIDAYIAAQRETEVK